ncbi:MAG TPA: HAD family phosphatase [Lacibacter sp.]|nr:HAD family phosphatase [Lacibacter sp.]HMO90512.1 HAD family phosphatase [Lacibacter sp.]
MTPVRNIIFDLGGVLLDIDYDATRRAFEDLGVTRFEEQFSQFHANALFQRLETGAVAPGVFLAQLQELLPAPVPEQRLVDAWNAMLGGFRQPSLALLPALRNRYRTFLLSNTNEIHLEAFSRLYATHFPGALFDHLFDAAYYSHRIGERKPDASAFLYVLQQHDLAPADTLFIDDSLPNIEAARALGLQTVHLLPGMRVEEIGLI